MMNAKKNFHKNASIFLKTPNKTSPNNNLTPKAPILKNSKMSHSLSSIWLLRPVLCLTLKTKLSNFIKLVNTKARKVTLLLVESQHFRES
jgi:hypothetical protein